jgi:Uma2 family endonuclease
MRQASWAEPVLTTAEELLALPEDGRCYELVEGRLVRMAPTGYLHSRISVALFRALDRFMDAHEELGMLFPQEAGFLLARNPDTVLAADAAFVRRDRLPPPDLTGYPALAPDLAVEVISPSQSMSQLRDKAEDWLHHGVRLVWIVDPAGRRVEAHRPDGRTDVLTSGQTLSGEDVLPGFTLAVDDIFAS